MMSLTSNNQKPLAVVTGSGSGIGLAFAKNLAKQGYDLLLVESNSENLSECEQELNEAFPNIKTNSVLGDVAVEDTWNLVLSKLGDRSISIIVNNAGTLLAGDISECQPQDLKRVIDVNLVGMILACHALIPKLSQQPTGHYPTGLINIASIFAALSPPGFSAYNASKAGVVALSETLRGELKEHGHTVTVILPGLVPTALFKGGRYPDESYRNQVLEYATGAELTTESVALQALNAFSKGRLQVAIGKRANRYWQVKRWVPTTLIDVVSKKTRQALGN